MSIAVWVPDGRGGGEGRENGRGGGGRENGRGGVGGGKVNTRLDVLHPDIHTHLVKEHLVVNYEINHIYYVFYYSIRPFPFQMLETRMEVMLSLPDVLLHRGHGRLGMRLG